MEALRAFLGKQDGEATKVRGVHVVVDEFFPLEGLYVDSLQRRYGVRMHVIRAPEYCKDEGAAIARLLAAECGDLLFVSDARHCPQSIGRDGARAGGVTAVRYSAVCDRPMTDRANRPSRRLELEG